MQRTAASYPMTIFLNHDYTVPESVFGSTVDAKVVTRSDNGTLYTDLDLEIRVDESNPRAAQAADSIEGGSKFGVSIGGYIKDYRLKDPKDPFGGLIIEDLELKEASVVGLPANPRSWVQYAVKAIKRFEREKAAEDKMNEEAMTVGDFTDLVKVLTSTGLPGAVADPPEPEETPEEPTDAEIEGAEEEPSEDAALSAISASETPASPPSEVTAAETDEIARVSVSLALGAYKAEVIRLSELVDTLTQERDAALATLREATAIVNQIASLPLGRKASFAAKVEDYRAAISGVYDPEVLAFLKGTEPQ